MRAVTPALLIRGALVIAGAALGTALVCGCGWGCGQGRGVVETVAFVGGWSLSVLPVHVRIGLGAEVRSEVVRERRSPGEERGAGEEREEGE